MASNSERHSHLSDSQATTRPGDQGATDTDEASGPGPSLDIHIHLFGAGDSGSGCRLSRTITEGDAFRALSIKLGIGRRASTLDESYALALIEQLDQSNLHKGVILSQDAFYDPDGKPNWEMTHFYVPNDYLFQTVALCSDKMIPCVSINPQRVDAIDELDRCAARGATLLKIHPPTQGVDPSDTKYTSFFRRCAELNVVVMVHTGHEHSAPIVDAGLANPSKLALALEQGCTVVACHCGTGWTTDTPDMLPDFLTMIRKYDNLWGDTSVLGSAGRATDVVRLLADTGAEQRLLHGSDFPFPVDPDAFTSVLGESEVASVQIVRNALDQDLALKEALGFGQASAERAYRLICGSASL